MQKSCTVNGGDTYTYTRAVYKGTAASADSRLNGAITIHAQSMVDDTTGIGAVIGQYNIVDASAPRAFGRIEASLSSGQMSGAVRGHAPKPWGELFAGLNGGFDASGASPAPMSEPAAERPRASCSSTARACARSTCTKARLHRGVRTTRGAAL